VRDAARLGKIQLETAFGRRERFQAHIISGVQSLGKHNGGDAAKSHSRRTIALCSIGASPQIRAAGQSAARTACEMDKIRISIGTRCR
jgi:hypothetical protein